MADWTFNPTGTGRTGTIQQWTVPTSGTYRITAYGAQGGDSSYSGGLGAKFSGEVMLQAGQVVEIAIGQRGINSSTGAGGGGGTFTALNGSPLVVAGGGGGGSPNSPGSPGTTDANGTPSSGGNSVGGVDGLGGYPDPQGNWSGAGGAGFYGDGGDGGTSQATFGGKSWANGLEGGGGSGGYHADGGFGGGGAASWAAGGGGGYSGGGGDYSAGTSADRQGGGGGGSFTSGSNPQGEAGNQSGDGLVVIEQLSLFQPVDIDRQRYSLGATWTDSGADSYTATLSNVGGLVEAQTVTAAACLFENLTQDTAYTLELMATTGGVDSTPETFATSTIPAVPPQEAPDPSHTMAVGGALDRVATITWPAIFDTAGYRIQVVRDGDPLPLIDAPTPAIDVELLDGTSATLTITPYNQDGDGPAATYLVAAAPPQVTDLDVVISDASMVVDWTPWPGSAGHIFRVLLNGELIRADFGTSPPRDVAIAPLTEYQLEVYAYNDAGVGQPATLAITWETTGGYPPGETEAPPGAASSAYTPQAGGSVWLDLCGAYAPPPAGSLAFDFDRETRYTPPAWNQVDLAFDGPYAAPTASNAGLDFTPACWSGSGALPTQSTTLLVAASLAPPSTEISAKAVLPARIAASIPPPGVEIRTAFVTFPLRVVATLPAPGIEIRGTTTMPLRVAAGLPLPDIEIRANNVVGMRVAASLATLQATARLGLDNNVYRGPSQEVESRYEQAGRQTRTAISRYRFGKAIGHESQNPYQQAKPLDQSLQAPASQLPQANALRRIVQEQATALQRQHSSTNRYLPRQDAGRQARSEEAIPLSNAARVLGYFLPHLRTRRDLPFEQAGRIMAKHWDGGWQNGEFLPRSERSPFEQATKPGPGTSPLTPYVPRSPIEWPEPEPTPGTPGTGTPARRWCKWQPNPNLDFSDSLPADPDLDFSEKGICPPRRIFLVSNTASLTLVATGQALEASAISAAIDADSWAWELRATVHGQASLDAVRNASQPVEIEATLNGHTWRGVLDSWSRNRQFGEVPTVTLSARSLAAYLAAPHAAPRSYTETQTRTAQQLAEQELPLGWTLDWQIDDWLVEPEAWHYTNRTPIEAITAIAIAAGAVVQAHPSQPRLVIAPRYAAPHWAWNGQTPDVTLPLDVLTRLGSERRSTEALNGVYVSGETTGVLALVKRTGTAADRLGEMVVDPLITRQAAARGRGIAVLSASGPQTRESLALPLAADIAGLLETGQLVRVDPTGDDWRGLVRSVSLNARLQNDALTIEQTAELERHLEETA